MQRLGSFWLTDNDLTQFYQNQSQMFFLEDLADFCENFTDNKSRLKNFEGDILSNLSSSDSFIVLMISVESSSGFKSISVYLIQYFVAMF